MNAGSPFTAMEKTMKRIAFTLTFTSMIWFFAVSDLLSAETGFTCGKCHPTSSEVLPKHHKKTTSFVGCFKCHGVSTPSLSTKVHSAHLANQTAGAQSCLACHPSDGQYFVVKADGQTKIKIEDLSDFAIKMDSWVKSDYLANAHRQNGVSCQACHATYDEDDPLTEKCIGCHGSYDVLIPKTANTKLPKNPHKSHYPTLKCTSCHNSHSEFRDFCASCHGQRLKWKPKLK